MRNADNERRGLVSTTSPAELATSLSLIAGLRARSGPSWAAFVSLYAPLVVRWCDRQGLSDADVADVAQEVFRCVAQDLSGFVKETDAHTFRGWLSRITHRQIANFYRNRKHALPAAGGSDALSQLHKLPDPACDEPSPQETEHEDRFLFQQAIALIRGEFSDRHWQMFWRVAVDGIPAPAVAAEFETTSAAVRQTKARVLRRLREVVGSPDESVQERPDNTDR